MLGLGLQYFPTEDFSLPQLALLVEAEGLLEFLRKGICKHLNFMERVMGIEPTLAAWEAAVLPLNYTRAA